MFFAPQMDVEASRGLWFSETFPQVGKSLSPTDNFSPFNHFYTNDFLFCVGSENILCSKICHLRKKALDMQ